MNLGYTKVLPGDERPARPDGTCFYCRAEMGGERAEGCVLRRRTVVIEYRIKTVIAVPEDWDVMMIEFHRNEGSWCASNLLAELDAIVCDHNSCGPDGREHRCLCNQVEARFLAEAREGDHEALGYNWKHSQQKEVD